jgi:hypothetical protein
MHRNFQYGVSGSTKGGTSLTSVGCTPGFPVLPLRLFLSIPTPLTSVHWRLHPPLARERTSLLQNRPSLSMEIRIFNQEKGSIFEGKGSPKAPLLVPHRVLWIQIKFLFQKVFKSSFQLISLLLA